MSVATSTAIALAVGAGGAAANMYGAKKGADAAKKAAAIQGASVDKAQAFNEKAWQQQQEALNPYRQAGQYSLAALMARQYGGSAGQYMPPQGYGGGPGGMPPQPSPGQFTGQGGQGMPLGGPPPFSLAAMQNRGTANMNAGDVGMRNIPPGAINAPVRRF